MIHLLAIISFALAVIFYAWTITHGTITSELFMLIGMFLWCASDHPRVP